MSDPYSLKPDADSPKPSETDMASFHAGEIVTSVWNSEETFDVCLVLVAARLAQILREAKRSALLEVARAGCYFCAGNGPDYAETPVPHGGEGWEHQHMSGTQSTVCERPEVWDALSLPPGGGR